MKFDELLAIIDDTNIDVYDTTETDFHRTLWRGHDYDFTYDQVDKDIQDCEVARVWVDGDVLNVFVDTAI